MTKTIWAKRTCGNDTRDSRNTDCQARKCDQVLRNRLYTGGKASYGFPKNVWGQTWRRRRAGNNEGSRWEDALVSLPLLVHSCSLIDSLEWQIVHADKSSHDNATQNRAGILTPNLWGEPVTQERGMGWVGKGVERSQRRSGWPRRRRRYTSLSLSGAASDEFPLSSFIQEGKETCASVWCDPSLGYSGEQSVPDHRPYQSHSWPDITTAVIEITTRAPTALLYLEYACSYGPGG